MLFLACPLTLTFPARFNSPSALPNRNCSRLFWSSSRPYVFPSLSSVIDVCWRWMSLTGASCPLLSRSAWKPSSPCHAVALLATALSATSAPASPSLFVCYTAPEQRKEVPIISASCYINLPCPFGALAVLWWPRCSALWHCPGGDKLRLLLLSFLVPLSQPLLLFSLLEQPVCHTGY